MDNLLDRYLADGWPTIFLLRHGTLQAPDTQKRYLGQTNLALDNRGRQQAHFWQQQLATIPLAAVCCSDLTRCIQTADIIAAGRHLPVSPVADFREIDLGAWEGRTFADVRQQWPADFRRRGEEIADFRPPDGESFADLAGRVLPAFQQLGEQKVGHQLVVAHAGVNRVILCHLLGLPLERLLHIPQGFAAMNVLVQKHETWRVQALNLLPG